MRRVWFVLVAAIGCGCAGVSPEPEQLAGRTFATPTLSSGDRATAERMQQAALDAVEQRQWSDAVRRADAALAYDPGLARARAALGFALAEQARLVDPPDLFLLHRGDGETASAIRLAPRDPLVALLRGRLLAGTGHLSAAALAVESCLPLLLADADPARMALLEAAAEWRYELGEERAALPHLRALAAVDDRRSITWFRIGSCLLRTAEASAAAVEAAAAFARCAELAPGDDDAQYAVIAAHVRAAELAKEEGRTEVAGEQLAAARRVAEAAAGRFPAAAEPRFRAGVVAERQGDPLAARGEYRAALERQPQHAGALLNLAAILASSGDEADRQEARELWRRALVPAVGLAADERQRIEALLAGDGVDRDGAVREAADPHR